MIEVIMAVIILALVSWFGYEYFKHVKLKHATAAMRFMLG